MDSADNVVAVDVMGSDGGTASMIRGIELAMKLFPGEIGSLILVGNEDEINEQTSKKKSYWNGKDTTVCHAQQTIDMADKPMSALRYKKNSSMFKAIELLQNKQASGMLSCGNTSCLVAGGTLKLRTMPGIDRAALATVIPSPANPFVLIDVGANLETSTKSFVHNAILGALYYNVAVNPQRFPRVGLLTIGTEEGKGNESILEAHEVLKKIDGKINYYGLIEGFQLFSDVVDVVVCDGFVGNILLKTMESLAGTIKNYLKSEIKKNPIRMLGAVLASGAFRSLKKNLTADKYGGAPLMGLNRTIVKSHGSSSVEAIAHALCLTFRLAKKNHEHFLGDAIEKANSLTK